MTEMRTISPTPGFGGTAALNDDAALQALQTGLGNGVAQVDSAKILAELAKLASSLQAQNPNGVPGVTNSNGAPHIDGVTIDFSAEDMAAALLVLQGKTQEAQLNTAREGLTTNKKKLEEKNQQAMNKINDWIQKCKDAEAKSKAAGIFGWVAKIASFLASAIAVAVAAVATVASGGAAAPFLALAVVGLVGTTISLASQISQAAGGPALELSSLMAKAFSTILEAVGVPKEKAEQIGKIASGIVGMYTGAVLLDPNFAGQALGGILELSGVDPAKAAIASAAFTAVVSIAISVVMIAATAGAGTGAAVSQIGSVLNTAAKIGQAAAGVTAGAATITQGALTIAKGVDEKAAANAQADKKLIDAIIAKLQKQMEDDREQIKKVLDEIMEGVNIVSKMINDAASSRTQLAGNLTTGKNQMI